MSSMTSGSNNANSEFPNAQETWVPTDSPGALSACFEYIGRTALVLTGPYTGHRYCFRQPGARLRVDGRDSHALMAVPVLRAIAA